MTEPKLEQISLDDERRRVRAGRIEPEIHRHISTAIQTLNEQSNQAFVFTLPEGMKYTTVRSWIAKIAVSLNVPLTIRKYDGGKAFIFWKATEEEMRAKADAPRGRKRKD
jgi:hypothetical protein